MSPAQKKLRSNTYEYRRWTEEEDEALREDWRMGRPVGTSRMPDRTLNAARLRSAELGLRSRRYWTDQDDAILREEYTKGPGYLERVEKRTGRTRRAIQKRLTTLGGATGRLAKYTPEQIERARDLRAQGLRLAEISERIGMHTSSVASYTAGMGKRRARKKGKPKRKPRSEAA